MKFVLALWTGVVVFGLACESKTVSNSTTETPVKAASAAEEPVGSQENEDKDQKKNPDGTPKVFITIENKETGELKEVEADVQLKSGETFFLPTYNPAAVASFENVDLVNQRDASVKVDLDRVVLIEYWSSDGLTQNQFWSQMREMEKKYKDNENIKFLSINFDTALDGDDQIASGLEAIKRFTPPEKVYFDLNDSFRDSFPVIGPTMYLLVDSRQQITFFGRGDNPRTQEVFDNVRDALLHFESKKNGGIKVTNRNEN